MIKPKILVVDDEKQAAQGIKKLLDFEKKYEVDVAYDGKEAYEKLLKKTYDLVITDYKMPGMDGITLLKKIKEKFPDVEVIVVTAYGTEVGPAVEAMKLGAFDYITKPIQVDELLIQIEKALERKSLYHEKEELQKALDEKYGFENIIGKSPQMQKVFEIVKLVAPTNTTVLITGESGTGKELIANAIHRLSNRRNKPLIKVHCAALPPTLLESELFGHEKGAFTGAIRSKPGRFELADNSSIFLDEISEIEPHIQVKLLRVLQEHEFERVGGVKTIKVDVRIIAATNKDLKKLVEEGKFREDLYYRLKVVEINLPPLRERTGDIPLFIEHFLKYFSEYHNKKIEGISPRAMKILLSYSWPGNVRQLKNTIESMVVLTRNKILDVNDIPPEIFEENKKRDSITLPIGLKLEKAEKEYILATLHAYNYNKAKTAKVLGIGRKTLYRKLEKYGVENE